MLSLSSCTKDTVTLRAKISHYGSSKADIGGSEKVYLDQNTPRWHNGDALRINESVVAISTSDGSSATMQVPSADSYKAVYPSSIVEELTNEGTASLTLPRLQVYREDDNQRQIVSTPMCAASSGTTLHFKNMGALLAISLTNATSHESITVDSVSVKSVAYGSTNAPATAMWGTATATISASEPTYTFTAQPTAGVNDSVTLAREGNQSLNIVLSNNTQSRTVYVYVPAIRSDANNLFCIRVFARNGNAWYTYLKAQTTSGSGNIGRNQKAEVPFGMDGSIEHKFVIGAIDGLFTVDNVGSKVYFSKGNLQYQKIGTHSAADGSTKEGTWRFAENQWDYIGYNVNYPNCAALGSWFDLFGWGTSGYQREPYYFNDTSANYSSSVAGTNNDWGVYNAISNGGNTAGIWRTLTASEWNYLLTMRVVNGGTGRGHSYQVMKVNSAWGMLIYPDGYTQQSNYSINSVLTAVPSGCAFLPLAGHRKATQYENEYSQQGYYWSSTPMANTSNISTNTSNISKRSFRVYINFSSGSSNASVIASEGSARHFGLSVRLVRDDPYTTQSSSN